MMWVKLNKQTAYDYTIDTSVTVSMGSLLWQLKTALVVHHSVHNDERKFSIYWHIQKCMLRNKVIVASKYKMFVFDKNQY